MEIKLMLLSLMAVTVLSHSCHQTLVFSHRSGSLSPQQNYEYTQQIDPATPPFVPELQCTALCMSFTALFVKFQISTLDHQERYWRKECSDLFFAFPFDSFVPWKHGYFNGPFCHNAGYFLANERYEKCSSSTFLSRKSSFS